MDGPLLEAIYDRNRIVALLRYSKEHGTTIGVQSPSLGGNVYVTAIEDIISGDETVVIMRTYDSSGTILNISKVKLTDIRCVFPFQPVFENPYIKDFHRYTLGGSYS